LEYQINIFDDDNEADETIESVNNQTLDYTDKTTIKNQEYYCYHIAAVRNGNTDIKSISNTVCIPNILYAFLPNAFTPNEDGVNDYFEAKGKNIIEYEITIYNQWGMVMFHSTDINDSWDGKYNNHPCPTGVYAYSVKFFGSLGQNKVQAGTMHLIK
jgi:gliding motility-associated-like protein